MKNETQKHNLEKKTIPELYGIRQEQIDKNYLGAIEQLIEGFRVTISLILEVIAATRQVKYMENPKVINNIIKTHEENFLRSANTKTQVTIDSEMRQALETLGNEGMLILTNHQGGGLETFISRALLGKFTDKIVNWVLKEELTKIPVFGQLLLKAGSVPLSRDPYAFFDNLPRYAEQIAQRLKKGHIVIMSFEGTRSKNGDICTGHAGFISRVLKEINKAMREESFQKGLMIVDTFSALSKGMEKNPLVRTRMKSGIRIHLSKLDEDISLRPGKKNPKNIFEIAREKLKEILVAAIKKELVGEKDPTFD